MGRKTKNIHYIYKTTCNVTGRWYVGMHSTNNLEDGYMGSGIRLRRSIRKYGVDNHIKEILEYFDNRELLIEAEKKVITPEMIDDNNCMNLRGGGEGGFISLKFCSIGGKIGGEIHKERMKNDVDYNKNNRLIAAENFRKAHQEGKIPYGNFKDKIHSEETKKLMSESSKGTGIGETNSQYGTCWITNDIEDKKLKKDGLIPEGWKLGRKKKKNKL